MKILLHICCSNCAIYPIKIFKADGDDLTGFWFNPNIHPYDEYRSRLDSLKKLAKQWHTDIHYIEEYTPKDYFNKLGITDPDASGLSDIPPFPERCASCYMLRLEKTARYAADNGFDAFSTTLLISPYQDFEKLAATGKELENKYNVKFHLKDFRPFFRDAMNLSKELDLYRQKYCGCIYSREERKIKKGKR
jgi:predicted adenine nucleotide alpha hydrolase (AANH) superfamily ATPase